MVPRDTVDPTCGGVGFVSAQHDASGLRLPIDQVVRIAEARHVVRKLMTRHGQQRRVLVVDRIRRADSSGETSSTSRPMPRARLTPRCSSFSDSSLDAKRRPPTSSKTPSSSYSSMLYRRNRIMVGDGLNCVTRPAAWQVEPLVSSSFSTSTVSCQPALARWYATLAP